MEAFDAKIVYFYYNSGSLSVHNILTDGDSSYVPKMEGRKPEQRCNLVVGEVFSM